MRKDQHVVPVKDGWAVKSEGDQNYSSIHKTQDEAIEAARKIAKKEKSEIVIHRMNSHQTPHEFDSSDDNPSSSKNTPD